MLKIAVIGGADTVIGFKALGLEVFAASTQEEAREAMRRAGILNLFRVTEHTACYERSGWRHTAHAAGDDGVKMRVYEAEC